METLVKRLVVAAGLLLMASGAQAALIDRGEGFIYDDVQDITWTQNANINGPDTWVNQVAWAAGYSQTHTVYGTFADWRLPATGQPDPSCSDQVDPGGGLPLQGYGTGCTGSEMGHLSNVDGISSSSMGLFTNVQPGWYWSGTDSGPAWPDKTFFNGFGPDWGGYQDVGTNFGAVEKHGWAVRDGDVALIPEPSTALLLAMGLVGLTGARRRTH